MDLPNLLSSPTITTETTAAPESKPQIQDYLPSITLPFLVILSFTSPPFYGRGVFFAGLIIITFYLSLTSPWPPNEEASRPSRYGIASVWLLLLPVLERLLLHVPEREFWRVDAGYVTDHDHHHHHENGDEGGWEKGKRPDRYPSPHPLSSAPPLRPPSPPPPWTWRKLRWAMALASTPRGVGWNIASRRVRAVCTLTARKKIGRLAFVSTSLLRAMWGYLALDAVLVFGHDLPVPEGWSWNGTTIKDVVVAELLMVVCTYASMTMQFEVLAALSVGLGFSKPDDWPPLFGSLADCYSVSNVWGKFWHTYIRLPVLGFGHFIVRSFHIPEKSTLAYLIILIVGFAISDFFHILSLAVIREDDISLQDLTLNMSVFFMAQPIAAIVEAVLIRMYEKLTPSKPPPIPSHRLLTGNRDQKERSDDSPSRIWRIIGYFWVFCWFSFTGWWFTKAYIAVGVRDWVIPLSFWQGMMKLWR